MRLCVFAASVVFATTPLRSQGNLEPLKPDGRGQISYFIAEGISRSNYLPTDAQLAEWSFEAWQREAPDRLHFERIADESRAVVRLYFLRPTRGELGQASSPRAHSPGISRPSTIYINLPNPPQMDPRYAARLREPLTRDAAVFFLCLHEVGHALGIGHTVGPKNVMREGAEGQFFPTLDSFRRRIHTRNDLRTQNWFTEVDLEQLRLLYPPVTAPTASGAH